MKLIFATQNPAKVEEMKAIMRGLAVEILSAAEAGINDDVIEDGQTFTANARKKAQFVAHKAKQWAMADDTGLCVQALNGEPGVLSARYAGENKTGEEKVQYLLQKLTGVPVNKRQAYFETAVVLCSPDNRYWVFTGRVEGQITTEPRGVIRPTLPYDLIFIPIGHNRTFAEMPDGEKNAISHRGLAFRQLKEFIQANGLK